MFFWWGHIPNHINFVKEEKDGRQMDFEKVKELLKESIDEGENLFEIMEIFADKVYEQGKQDGKDSE